MGAREVERSLRGRGNNGTSRARHAVCQSLRNGTSVVTEAKLVAADAYDSTIVAAWGAISAARGPRTAKAAGARRTGAGASRRRLGAVVRLGGAIAGGLWSRRLRAGNGLVGDGGRCGCGSWGRGGTRGEDTTTVGRERGISRALRRGCRGTRLALSGGSDLAVSSSHLGHLVASRTGQSVSEMGTVTLDEVLARVGVVEVLSLSSAARRVRKVGNEHVRQRREGLRSALGRSLARSAADLDRSTVHVEFAVANLVEPGPGEGVLAIRNLGGHLDGKGGSAMTVGVSRCKVASALDGQPPTTLWITFHCDFSEGWGSVVMENWHEPPPWVAEPMKEMVLVSPAFHWFISVTSYTPERCLQGKSPGARGELLRDDLP